MKRFKDLSQNEYNRLASAYYLKIGHKTVNEEKLSFQFFATIYRRLEKVLQKKFSTVGYKIVRLAEPPKKQGVGVFYKVVSLKDAFGFSVVTKTLNFTHLMEDLRYVNPQHSREVPDVKIVDPEYLEEKIQEVAEQAFLKFLTLSKKAAERIIYEQTGNASQSYSTSLGSNQNQAPLL